jgi:hypothetical protein
LECRDGPASLIDVTCNGYQEPSAGIHLTHVKYQGSNRFEHWQLLRDVHAISI